MGLGRENEDEVGRGDVGFGACGMKSKRMVVGEWW
jgi:hypothetical protein